MNITKDHIREWLEEKAMYNFYDGGTVNMAECIDLIHLSINDLAPNWVSVDDELPDEGEEVLMYMNDGAVMSDIKCHSGRYSNKYGFERSRVTHWMPLPEPPK